MIAKLSSFIKDLPDEFPGGSKDKNKGLRLVATFHAWSRTRGFEFECFSKEFGEHGDEESGGLAGSWSLVMGGVRWYLFGHRRACLRQK